LLVQYQNAGNSVFTSGACEPEESDIAIRSAKRMGYGCQAVDRGCLPEDKPTKGRSEVDSSEEIDWVLRWRPHPSNSIQSVPRWGMVKVDFRSIRYTTVTEQSDNAMSGKGSEGTLDLNHRLEPARLDPGCPIPKEACLERRTNLVY